ncbi:uncharacterized protein E0L32_002165 [Thyridium curvatum]|uniref:F-box domain-containing protein n=1 Tax=Thyridium curvatum TaxID=1093900 RepID=A0A507AFV1_9PEZI|nr:uncharacterized protein E0L32_001968 [Thyridium curvatum]XP_030989273.1 uncharacterized protein E0L32_002165 [Thyridium curvatum]TPX07365.1 hypothetical protein E0L32_001968 [Thyridium curvatum]TPX07562.1 hypothetical protein E0L32_002165 [Thyridium curvatum]
MNCSSPYLSISTADSSQRAYQEMDRFAALPPEILCEVLKSLPNLHSLQNLRRASPAVNSLLHEEDSPVTSDIVESIISSNLVHSTRLTVRLVILLAWGVDGHHVLFEAPDDLRDILWGPHREAPPARERHRDTVGHRPLTRYTGLPSAVLVRVIALSERVHELGHRCFHVMLARVLASQPRRPKDPSLNYVAYLRQVQAARRERAPSRPPTPEPESEPVPFPPAATAPPSWGETQRLEAVSWEYALEAMKLYLPPSSDPVTTAWQASIREVFQPPAEYYVPQWTSYSALEECLPEQVMRLSEAINVLPALQQSCCQGGPLMDDHEEWKPPAYLNTKQDRLDLEPDWGIYPTWLVSPTKREEWSPIFQAELHDFFPLGFALWCRKRMAALGFLAQKDAKTQRKRVADWPKLNGKWPAHNVEYSDQFACRSVMSPSQVEAMHERLASWWADNVVNQPPRGR